MERLAAPGHPKVVVAELRPPHILVTHAPVFRQHDLNRMTPDLELAAQPEHHIAKAAGLGHRRALGCNHHDVHDSPRDRSTMHSSAEGKLCVMSSAFSDKPDGSVFCEPIPILPRPGDALTISTGTNAIRGWGAPAPMLNNKGRSSNAQYVLFTHPGLRAGSAHRLDGLQQEDLGRAGTVSIGGVATQMDDVQLYDPPLTTSCCQRRGSETDRAVCRLGDAQLTPRRQLRARSGCSANEGRLRGRTEAGL